MTFRIWYESIFGGGSVDQQEPGTASVTPTIFPGGLNRTAMDDKDLRPLPNEYPKKLLRAKNFLDALRPRQDKTNNMKK
jgi:hypothetical protein